MDKEPTQGQLIEFIRTRLAVDDPPVAASRAARGEAGRVGFRYPEGQVGWFSDAEQLGAVLADDAGFRALELGAWLTTPDGELIAAAVSEVLAPSYRPEFQLVVSALKWAASRQQQAGWQRAVGVGVLGGLAALVIWYFRDR